MENNGKRNKIDEEKFLGKENCIRQKIWLMTPWMGFHFVAISLPNKQSQFSKLSGDSNMKIQTHAFLSPRQ